MKFMFEFDIFFKDNIEINKTQIPQPGKQHHHHFERKKKIIDEGIPDEINKRSTGFVSIKPVVIFILRTLIIPIRIGPAT